MQRSGLLDWEGDDGRLTFEMSGFEAAKLQAQGDVVPSSLAYAVLLAAGDQYDCSSVDLLAWKD